MHAYITVGCATTGGGKVVTGQNTFLIDGRAIACLGDQATCPTHKRIARIVSGCDPHMIINNKAAALANALLDCGCHCIPNQNLVVGDNGGGFNIAAGSTDEPVFYFNDPNINSLVAEKEDLLNGFYYNVDTGFFEGEITKGKGSIQDVYTCTSKKSAEKFEGIKKVPISNHNKFIFEASIIYGESSAFRSAKNDELKFEMFSIASVFQKNKEAYGGTSDQAKNFRSISPEARNNTKMQFAIAAQINVLNKGKDYSNGADMWDGAEQAMFPATDKRRSTGRFELHMNTMGWTISDEHYAKWKNNVGSSFVAPQHRPAPDNYGGYKNKGKMRLKSTAVYNRTIFWNSK